VSREQVSSLADKLEDSDEAFAISHHEVVGPRVEAQRCQKQVSSASVALLPLETQTLIKALGNIDVRESPSVSIVLPDVNGQVMRTSDELLLGCLRLGCVLVAIPTLKLSLLS
jgi:hypothetical protein